MRTWNAPWTTCMHCGKRGYDDRRAARRARKGHPNPRQVGVYECPARPGTFHLGHKPRELIEGRTSRSDLAHYAPEPT